MLCALFRFLAFHVEITTSFLLLHCSIYSYKKINNIFQLNRISFCGWINLHVTNSFLSQTLSMYHSVEYESEQQLVPVERWHYSLNPHLHYNCSYCMQGHRFEVAPRVHSLLVLQRLPLCLIALRYLRLNTLDYECRYYSL